MFNAINKLLKDLENLPFWAAVITLILAIGLVFGVVCFEAWMCFILWNGCLIYACPFFVEVGYWQMMGIWLLLRFLLPRSSGSSSNE